MDIREKQQWTQWLETHPEWVEGLCNFLNTNSGLVFSTNDKKMFWHDLANILAPILLTRFLNARKGPKNAV